MDEGLHDSASDRPAVGPETHVPSRLPDTPAFEDRFDDTTVRDEEIEEGKAAAILAYVPFGCFVALVRYRDNAFARKHGIQGLMLTFFEVLAGLFLVPRISEYFWVTVVFACLASAVTGIYYALQGRDWIVPFAGQWFADRFDLEKTIPRSFVDDDTRQ